MRGRGLKLFRWCYLKYHVEVALHARAWIETIVLLRIWKSQAVALHARAWIETYRSTLRAWHPMCRPPCEGVD